MVDPVRSRFVLEIVKEASRLVCADDSRRSTANHREPRHSRTLTEPSPFLAGMPISGTDDYVDVDA